MPRSDPILSNFTGGEFSPSLYGRVDLAKYYNSCRLLENFLVKPQGGAVRRPGTYYTSDVKNHTKKVRLIPFQFSTTQAYILEFGNEYIRFYMDNGQIESAGNPYEIATTYQEADLSGLVYAQTADIMYIVHPSYAVYKITRTGHTSWTWTAVSFTANPFTGADDYPSCVEFFEQRLFFANTNNNPQKIWSSKSGDYEDMTTGALDDDALEYTIAASKVNAIKWLAAKDVLLIGTVDAEWRLGASSASEPITPTNVLCRRQSTYGSALVRPATVGQVVLFLQKAERKVRELVYNFEQDTYLAPDMNLLAEHMTESGIVDMAYQQEPDSILWCVLRNGYLVGMTYQRDQEVVGWHRHITDGKVESVATIPSTAIVNEDSEVDYMEYADNAAAQAAYPVVGKEIDYMEYATNVLAQAAYVSNDIYGSDFCTGGTATADSEHGGFEADEAFDDNEGTRWSTIDNDALPHRIKYDLGVGVTKVARKLRIKTYEGRTKNFVFKGSNNDADWTTLTSGQHGNNDDWEEFTFSNATGYRYYKIDITSNWAAVNNEITSIWEIEIMELTNNLQCYSESTIKQQGSYSLKGIAKQTDSLNDTLTRTVSPVLNLSGYQTIKLDIRASRTGSNFKIGFHDAGGTTTEQTINIVAGNTWQTESIDMSGVSDANKDTIDSIIITILNADAENTFYLDNMYVDPTLVPYSENTIKEQGSYSLKIIATQDLSRDAYLLKTFASVLNMSTDEKIVLSVRASRTGENFKLQIKSDDTGVTTEKTINILVADTWQTVEWDISAVAVADKEDIKYLYIVITNDDATNTIYIDDVISRDEVETTGEDELWMSVKRNINGIVKRYVEYLKPQAFDNLEDAFLMDSGLSYDGLLATTFSGLDHLIGEEVAILADGLKVDPQIVDASGEITLATAARKVHAGLAYTSKLQIMNLEAGSQLGTSQGKIKRIHEVLARFKDTVGGKLGYDADNLEDIAGTTLFSGDKAVSFPYGYERDYFVMITQPDPLPMTVICLMPSIYTSDE